MISLPVDSKPVSGGTIRNILDISFFGIVNKAVARGLGGKMDTEGKETNLHFCDTFRALLCDTSAASWGILVLLHDLLNN